MTIILRPETETRLRVRAERDGQDISALADALLTEVLTDDPDALTDEEAAEARASIRRGLAAAAVGQVKPLTQAVAEARRRHGLPSSWASGVDGSA